MSSANRSFTDLVFDLDDTLLDTYGQLVPQAAREACTAMIENGLKTNLEVCLHAREHLAHTSERTHLFQSIAEKFGVSEGANPKVAADAGFRAFYDRKVEPSIKLISGAREMLESLKTHYKLHLVTAGHPDTQESKLRILGLRPCFDSVTIVNTFAKQEKGAAFAAIQAATKASSQNLLSIGNRLDTDISPAKRLGWSTAWVRYGEYAHTQIANPEENPDYTLQQITELPLVCQL